jgi:hypothetical protein
VLGLVAGSYQSTTSGKESWHERGGPSSPAHKGKSVEASSCGFGVRDNGLFELLKTLWFDRGGMPEMRVAKHFSIAEMGGYLKLFCRGVVMAI